MGINEGDRHHGEYKKLSASTNAQLSRSINSYEKNVTEHKDKINNPMAYWNNWDKMNTKEQEGRLAYWKNEINDFEAKLKIAKHILSERGLQNG
jgi:hypothetical protein